MSWATSLRWIAITIAVVAVIDPVITTRRRVDAVVSVVAADSAHAALAERARRALAARFTVVHTPFAGSAATVLVGAHVPDHANDASGAGFVLSPDTRAAVVLDEVRAPLWSPLHARVPIVARVAARAGAQPISVTLLQDDVALDRALVDTPRRDTTMYIPLTFVPTGSGATRLRVEVSGSGAVSRGDVLLDVRDVRWRVLFYEPRPSWLSTFVRRALEQDARFHVTGRTITSRGVATEYGRPPQGLDELSSAANYDALVIGAPELLDANQVAALERYLRRSGGAAVLLPDRAATGPYRLLAGPANASGPSADRVRRLSVGAGQLVVNTDLDGWRRRDPEVSDFDEYWRNLIAGLAAGAAPLEVLLRQNLLRPGEWIEADITVRDVALGNDSIRRARVAATISAADGTRTPVRVWPGERAGELVLRTRAPADPGSYTLDVTDGSNVAAIPLVVSEDVVTAQRAEPELLHAWATSRGGAVLAESALAELPDHIERALPAQRRAEAWRPMHSPWWILPFAFTLGAEWWTRRRRGLR